MALTKGIENLYGATFSYHKLQDVHIIVSDNGIQLRMTVDSYIDKDARKAHKKPVRTENIIDNADFALTPFYKLLKAKFTDYQDAQDDFEVINPNNADTILFVQQSPQGELISKHTETLAHDEEQPQEEQDTIALDTAAEQTTNQLEQTQTSED